MIIWGSKARELEVKTGRFHCPKCEREQNYRHIRLAKYFTLYFIPLFETDSLGDYVKCGGCNQDYKMEVLSHRPLSDYERLLLSVKAELESGTPLQVARVKWINGGGEPAEVEKSIKAILARGAPQCDRCHLTFVPGIARCTSCGAVMTRKITTLAELAAPPAPARSLEPSRASLPPRSREEIVELYYKQCALQAILDCEDLTAVADKLLAENALNGDTDKVDALVNGVFDALADKGELQRILAPIQDAGLKDLSTELKARVSKIDTQIAAMYGGGGDAALQCTCEWVAQVINVPLDFAGRIVSNRVGSNRVQ